MNEKFLKLNFCFLFVFDTILIAYKRIKSSGLLNCAPFLLDQISFCSMFHLQEWWRSGGGGLTLGPSQDHVPGRKDGTRYLARRPVCQKQRDQGADPVIPSVRNNGTRYLVPSPVCHKGRDQGAEPVRVLTPSGTRNTSQTGLTPTYLVFW